MQTEITFVGLDRLIADFEKAGGSAEPLVRVMLANTAGEITARTRELAPHATGTLQRSILPEVSYPTSKVTVNAPYGIYVETGTRPHWPPYGPGTALDLWAKKVGFGGSSFLIARKIAQRGTRAQPFFAPGIQKSMSYIDEQLRVVGNRLLTLMAGKF